jgi:hypothetical protein
MVCDRNGGESTNRIFYFSAETLNRANAENVLTADETFALAAPAEGWSRFGRERAASLASTLIDVERKMSDNHTSGDADLPGIDSWDRALDLEGITIISPSDGANDGRFIVVAEQPHSVILELELTDDTNRANNTVARITEAFPYCEDDDAHGSDRNDGIEGLAVCVRSGGLYWVEEGTKLHAPDAHPRLFFLEPRLGVSQRLARELRIEQARTTAMTHAVHAQRSGSMQTLNGLTCLQDGRLLAVDRNGGWILLIAPAGPTVTRWLNLYDLDGVNLRNRMADFPAPRRMPYISIEGIAVDPKGRIWLVDDPAMPEGFRDSCLVCISYMRVPPKPEANTTPPGTTSE